MIALRHARRAALAAILITAVLLAPLPALADDFVYSWGHPSPQGNTVFGIAFASAQEGWAVGGSGFVLHTLDGGEHWSFQHGPLEVAPDLYDVLVTPSGTLIACGAGEAIVRSEDGGATWTAPPHPPADDLRDLCSVPGGAISAAGADGAVLISDDDGLTWTSVGPGAGTIQHHVWRTALEGYVVGREVSHRTTNGGASWTQFIPAGPFGYNDVYFSTALDGYVLEDFGYWSTTNGGQTWTEHFLPIPPLYRFRTLVLGPDHWLLTCHGEGGELWETTNAGADWTQRQFSGVVGFPCIVQAPGGRIFYGSDAGDLYWSDDLGVTVQNATENFAQNAPFVQMKAIYTRPDGVLFASNQPTSGEDPTWLRSDDGGHTWAVPAQTPGLYWPHTGGFYDNERGLVGQYEEIRATFDGGETWQNGSLPATYRISDVAFPAADRTFAAAYRTGGGGGVLRSSDGGLNWDPVGGGLPQGTLTFSAIAFPTPLIGYAAGSPGAQQSRLYRTTDGGANWQLVSTTGLGDAIRSMCWFDAQRGVASLGFNDPGIHRTEDGGVTWTPVTGHSSVSFVRRNANEAGAVLFAGDAFLRTTDAGLTWEEIHPPMSGAFPGQPDYVTAAGPTGEAGWVLGGTRNRLLVAQPASPADAPSGPAPIGSTLSRSLRAEPNPASGRAVLRFENPASGPVRLDIHDADGSRVATLVDAVLPAGARSFRWDGRDARGEPLPGGVYFARVGTAAGTQSVKLILVR